MEYDELVEYISTTRNESIPAIDRELNALSKSRLKEGYIKDEDKSVKWNREFVENTNREIENQTKALREERGNLLESMYDKLREYLVEYGEGSITYTDAVRILCAISDDDYHFENGPHNTISACEEIVDLFISHNKEMQDGKKL